MHKNFDELDILSNEFESLDNLEVGFSHMLDLQLVLYKDLHSDNAPCINHEGDSYSKER